MVARDLFRSGDSNGCLRELSKIDFSDSALARKARSLECRALLRLGKPDRVISLLRECVPDIDEPEHLMLLGVACARAERAEIGIEVLRRAFSQVDEKSLLRAEITYTNGCGSLEPAET